MMFKDYFEYDETSKTCLRWKVDLFFSSGRSRGLKGREAGSLHKDGYWIVGIKKKQYRIHRVILEIFGVSVHGKVVDHINGIATDNRIENLRACSIHENSRNTAKSRRNTSGVVGVRKFTDKYGTFYCAAIWRDLNGKEHQKTFSCKKHGDQKAFDLAVSVREKMIEILNSNGAGYTSRHGKNISIDDA